MMTSAVVPEIATLNPEQQKAVVATEGRVLILAGAGSGKTRVLTMRMVYLVKYQGISPSKILGLTFTNKAAEEMRKRIAEMLDRKSAKEVTLCTFHSFCMQVLRQEIEHLGYTKNFTLYDEHDVRRLINLIVRDILKTDGELPSIAPTIAAINKARSKGLDCDSMEVEGVEWHDDFAKEVYKRLKESMRAYNAVDFDGLLWLTVELFEKHPNVLERYQERFRYVMIDEYQDTNPVQFRLAALLTGKYHNLCVVGDDDQSIYGWRGAEVRNILQFGEATVIKLEQNYRSTNSILKAAHALISCNEERHDKRLWSEQGDGNPIEVFNAPSDVEEAEAVACRIVRMKTQHGLRWKDIAVLYRSNALSRLLEQALMRHTWDKHGHWVKGVPYKIHGGTEFYDRREIKDIAAYLRLIVNERDQEALLRVINQPRRGIGETTLNKLTGYNRKHNIPLMTVLKGVCREEPDYMHLRREVSSQALSGLERFLHVLDKGKKQFEEMPLSDALRSLIEAIDYKRAIKEEVKSEQMRTMKWENVEEFVCSAADFEERCREKEVEVTLLAFIAETPLERDWEKEKKRGQADDDKVSLLTFHSSKGLEFPACFLVGVEDHIIPHEKSLLETGIEEERRLLYVAMTRAMRFLTISMARQRKRMGKTTPSRPSRFLQEIPKDYLAITRWDNVN